MEAEAAHEALGKPDHAEHAPRELELPRQRPQSRVPTGSTLETAEQSTRSCGWSGSRAM